ncbi:MAG: T9SS C-terminal target domain-containing protein, partial [Balneolaceae bacterium]
DVRTGTGFRLADETVTRLQITASEYPLEVMVNAGEGAKFLYRIRAIDGDNEIHFNLSYGIPERIDKQYSALYLEKVSDGEMVFETGIFPNFPNPFNPSTNIRYQLSQQSDVIVNVFDVVGRKVATLVDEQQVAGIYQVQFDGRNLASGVYMLRIQAGSYVNVQKITLIK